MGFMSRREAPLQGFGYDDVVHQFENRYKVRQTKTFLLLIIRS